MNKEYRVYDDMTNKTLFKGRHIECVTILSQVGEENDMFSHLWIEALESESE